jgi:hypothetical protein
MSSPEGVGLCVSRAFLSPQPALRSDHSFAICARSATSALAPKIPAKTHESGIAEAASKIRYATSVIGRIAVTSARWHCEAKDQKG